MLEFEISREGSKTKARITILDFMRADFGLSRDLLGGTSWDIIMRDKWEPRELADFQFNIGAHIHIPPLYILVFNSFSLGKTYIGFPWENLHCFNLIFIPIQTDPLKLSTLKHSKNLLWSHSIQNFSFRNIRFKWWKNKELVIKQMTNNTNNKNGYHKISFWHQNWNLIISKVAKANYILIHFLWIHV